MREFGFDIGSVSLKLAEFRNNDLIHTEYLIHQGKPYELLGRLLGSIENMDRLCLTGTMTKSLIDVLGAVYVNEVQATAEAVIAFCPAIQSIIEIGGEDSKLISVDANGLKDFSSNSICAAGTGIFLDQQAQRLRFKIEDYSRIAVQAKNPARIAGRCSVFAKSDMIHLQQIGTGPEDLLAGLCYSMARNFKSVIARSKKIAPPVAFVGGVAANQGIKKALHEILGLKEKELIIPDHFNCLGAIGAVLHARRQEQCAAYKGIEDFQKWLKRPDLIRRLPPLDGHRKWSLNIQHQNPLTKARAFLGIDVGSISTNLVLIDEKGGILARRYLWTKGRPMQVVMQGLTELQKEIGGNIEIVGAGTTGSGRYLIGELVGADLIKNEISAQARASVEIDPAVDTILEIGGQDSKYISLRNGVVVDFEMNKVCAAGTGSFLEEQAAILDVKLNDFGDLALRADAPINLGERCTVFIGSEVVHHQKDIKEKENLLAGLGYSIVFNYLNRVVSGKPVGDKVFFQGGVAANKAVVAAFERILGKEIIVPVNYDITGAIGIALLTRDAGIKRTRFRGFDLISRKFHTETFACKYCSNECEINKIVIQGEDPIFYGGRCERYEEKEKKTESVHPDYFRLRDETFFRTEKVEGIEIGIPRTLIFYELFPFFYRFLVELGFKPVLSAPTNRKTIEAGAELAVADTCLPVKAAFGHIQQLIKQGISEFFIPSVISMDRPDPGFSRSFVCPYVQTLPYTARAVFDQDIKIHTPHIYFDRGPAGVLEPLYDFARRFAKTRAEVSAAIKDGTGHQARINQEIAQLGKKVVDALDQDAAVICSRPYNGYDLTMNLDLPKKLRDLNMPALPIDFLPLDYAKLRDDFSNMYWLYGQKLLAAAELIRKDPRLHAVYLSNFSCGPDSFLNRFFKEKMQNKPFLMIEIDEHSADAGFITRCEAFLDSVGNAPRTSPALRIAARSELREKRKIYIPDMCDSAQVLAGAMQGAGIETEVLPFPDEQSVIVGRKYTSGRECLPAIITAGDMIKKIQSPDFDPDKSAFFMAQGSGPCRFGQYYRLHRIILDEFGLDQVPIYAPNQGPSLFDDLGKMGMKFLTSIWDGICAVDALEAKCRELRPYEVNTGSVNEIYQSALMRICERLKNGKGMISVLNDAAIRMKYLPIGQDTRKPKIAVVGEIYVRSQKFSNNFIERKLESMGCEVAMPSIAEWFFYTNFTRIRNCRWFKQYRRSFFTYGFDRYMRRRQKQIYEIFDLAPDPPIGAILDHARDIVHPSYEGETILTIGKTLEAIEENFAGVINVMPFTCMPGNIVATLYRRIKKNHPDFPLLSLAFDGLDHSVDAMRLETFAAQARQFKNSRQTDEEPSLTY